MIGAALTAPRALTVEALAKRFGATLALDKTSLTIAPGTVHALLGETAPVN